MIHLLHAGQVDQYFAGTLPPMRHGHVLERLSRCTACRDRYARHLLFERALPEGLRRRDERLWQTILGSAGVATEPAPDRVAPDRSPRRRMTGWLLLAAPLALALVVIVPLRPWSFVHQDPVARGGLPNAAMHPALHLYRSVGGKSEPIGQQLASGDGVLIAYSNPSASLGNLMVFAVDHRGSVHWYYPAYERLGADPVAVPIRTQAFGVELGEEIRHPLPAGALRMYALFLPQPKHVLEIEALIRAELARDGGSVENLGALPSVAGEQTSVLLEVTP